MQEFILIDTATMEVLAYMFAYPWDVYLDDGQCQWVPAKSEDE